jgi:hypothetical protein
MEKIIIKALALAGFNNAYEIADVIMATPNPTVATEMILGCYVPNLDAFGYYKKGETMYKVTEVSELNNLIKFERLVKRTKTVYFLTKEDASADFAVEERPRDYHSSKEVAIGGYHTFLESETMESFFNGYSKKVRIEESEFINTLIEWNYATIENVV